MIFHDFQELNINRLLLDLLQNRYQFIHQTVDCMRILQLLQQTAYYLLSAHSEIYIYIYIYIYIDCTARYTCWLIRGGGI